MAKPCTTFYTPHFRLPDPSGMAAGATTINYNHSRCHTTRCHCRLLVRRMLVEAPGAAQLLVLGVAHCVVCEGMLRTSPFVYPDRHGGRAARRTVRYLPW